MSHHARRPRGDVLDVESGLESLQASGEFHGPVEPLDDAHRHHCNDHIALVHETREEQFAAVVPFLREGLSDDERCLYVVEDSSKEAVVEALREGGVDVEAALESGQLTFHTVAETYLRDGTFRPDEMIEFYAEAIEAATGEYGGLRVAAETGWLLDDSVNLEAWMEYESLVNELFAGEDCLALCQYDRTRVPADLIRDLVRTHPHIIYDSTACHNFYYTPPEVFLGPDRPDDEVDRMLRTLVERSHAKSQLLEREGYLRDLYEVTSDRDRTFEEQLQAVFELGCEQFGLELGGMARVDPATDTFEVEYVSDDHEHLRPGATVDLSETYCRLVADGGTVSLTDPAAVDMTGSTACQEFGVDTYLGTHIDVDSGPDRTLFFVGSEPREEPFTDGERTLHHVTGQWVGYELERRERERHLRRQNEITADPETSFEEKLRALFELGCERFDLELGAMARVDADTFEVEYVSDDHEHFAPGVELPLSETYCTAATENEAAVGVSDPAEEGYDDTTLYREFGVRAYLGTRIEVGGDADWTFFFVSSERREDDFTDDERASLQTMGQWARYELEGRRREDRLDALNSLNQSLLTAETVEEVAGTVVDAADSLGLPATLVGRYDPDQGELRRADGTEAADRVLGPLSPFERGEGVGWEAFLEGERRQSTAGDRSPAAEVVAVPLCSNGVLVTGLAPGAVTDARLDFLETVAANVATAMERAHREQQLHAREAELEAQNETLTRLDRINTTIRDIDQALVSAASREEIESVVCDRLTDAGPYTFAWIGERNSLTDYLTPEVRAGDEAGYLDDVTAGEEPTTLADRAAAAREPRVVNDLLTDAGDGEWRQAALTRGYHAAIALPLVYEETMFGVLTVFADQPGVFDDLEEAVLAELSDNIAHAINAVQNKRSLVSNEVTELTFEVPATDLSFGELFRETGGVHVHDGIVADADGRLRWFFSTRGVPAGAVLEYESRLPVDAIELVAEGREDGDHVCRYEARVGRETLPSRVLEHGGKIHDLRAADGTVTVTVDLHTGTGVREFVEMFRTTYGGAALVGKRDRERPLGTVSEFRSVLTEELTPRQREVLETAYFSGYFEEPRTRTGGEVADTLGISQPTFTTHLRGAERKIYRELLEDATQAAPERRNP